jgi:nucleoside-diphosphate-sugar epimerase
VFETNVQSAYAVLQAAGEAGAKVVQASSESAYGFPFAAEPLAPDYLPVDEAHPTRPEDPYGTGKVVAEELAEMVTRRHGIPVASIRPSWIQLPGDYACREVVESGDLGGGIGNFWSYVDVRDVAGIVLAALEADVAGHEPFLAAARDTYLGRPVVEGLRETDAFAVDAIDGATDLAGEASALSTAKARAELGFEPAHDWREAADADVPAPELVN